jgi:HEAT repeat protein
MGKWRFQMDRLKNIAVLILIFSISILVWQTPSFSQPNIPKEKIPANIAPEIRTQIENLYDPDRATRAVAALKLGEMGEKAAPAIPFLIGLLEDDSNFEAYDTLFGRIEGNCSLAATDALVQIGKSAVEPLIVALKDKNLNVAKDPQFGPVGLSGVIDTLGQIGDPRAVKFLIPFLKHKNSFIRIDTVIALGSIGDPRAVDPLINLLKDDVRGVRNRTVRVLGKIGDPRAIGPITEMLKTETKDDAMRKNEEKALQQIKAKHPEISLAGDK